MIQRTQTDRKVWAKPPDEPDDLTSFHIWHGLWGRRFECRV